MSIEKLIEENTAALARLTAAIEKISTLTAKTEAVAGKKQENGKPSSGTVKEPPASSVPSDTGSTEGQAVDASLTQETLTAEFMALMKAKGTDTAKAVLTAFNVPKLSLVPEDKWPELLAAIKAAQA